MVSSKIAWVTPQGPSHKMDIEIREQKKEGERGLGHVAQFPVDSVSSDGEKNKTIPKVLSSTHAPSHSLPSKFTLTS